MPKPLDLAIFLHEFEREVRIPVLPAGLVKAVTAPLERLGRRQGLDVYYQRAAFEPAA
jgi:hypothetical protein